MKPIAISLSPNMQSDDLKIVWQTLLKPWTWRTPNKLVPQIEASLAERLNQKEAILVNSGRSGIQQALEAHGIGKGDEVIIQAFTCLAVPGAIKWAKAHPVYADIDPDTYNLDPQDVEAKITNKTKAIIIQHTFGIPANLTILQQIASSKNIVLIEDLAHGFGGTYLDKPLGSFADTTILSFGRDKTISCVFGGAVVTSNQQVAQSIRQAQQELSPPPLLWIKQQLLHPIFMAIIVPLYFKMSLGKILLVISQKLNLLSKAVTFRERHGQAPNFINYQFAPALAPLLHNQFSKLDEFTSHRRNVTAQYLEAFPSQKLNQYLKQSNWLRFPYRVKDNQQLLKAIKSQQILLGDWYTSPVTPSSSNSSSITDYQPGSCPNAEQAARQIINLPTYPKLSQSDTIRIINAIK